jgi:hypothetical protein
MALTQIPIFVHITKGTDLVACLSPCLSYTIAFDLPFTMANSSQINPFWNYYAKSWDLIFSHQRISKDDRFYVQHARDIDAEGDAFSIFWQYDNIEPSWEFDDVAEFCQGANLENLKKGGWGAGQRYSAWLDDRDLTESTYMQSPREYKNPLTASQLYYFLKIPV